MKKGWMKKLSLRFVLVAFVFFIMLVSMFVIGGAAVVVYRVGGPETFLRHGPMSPFLGMLLFSILLGTVLTAVVSNRTLKPLRKVIEATHKVAEGDFTVQVEEPNIPEIEDLTASFNKMVRELAGIETLRNDFISNFSHEFKTPIVSIRGFAKLLRQDDLPKEERDEYIDIIVQESERLAGLSNNVLELSKLENIEILSDREHFALDEQIRRAAALMEHRWREKGIEVSLEMESVPFYGSEDMLQQVWVNLLDNAIKFTEAGGRIDLELQKSEDAAVFTLADSGCGMDEQTQAHLFDRFYQGDTSHAAAGNGLGLAMVERIVALSGGGVEVQSEPGKGSRFVVTLPMAQEALSG